MRLKFFMLTFFMALFLLPEGFSLEPPTKKMIEQYKKDGTLAERIERAKKLGNYKMPEGAGAYLNYKFKKAIYKAKGNLSYLAHYDIRNGLWESRLTIGCGGDVGEKIKLTVYDNDGNNYGTKEIVIPPYGGFSKLVPDVFDFTIPEQGFIEIESKTFNIKGIVTFKYLPTSGETSLPLIQKTSKILIFPLIENTDGKSTGIAVINSSERENTVTFELYDYWGFKKATRTVILSGKQKYVDMLQNLFGSSLISRGVIKVSGEKDITGFALSFTENNTNIIAIPSNIIETQ